MPFHCHGRFFEQPTKLLLVRQPLQHALDCCCGDELWDIFVLGMEDVSGVGDGPWMLSIELVVSPAR